MIWIVSAFAAELSGTVMGEDGAPVAGVTVVAYTPSLDYASATSTSDGSWSILDIPAGAYRLRFMPSDTGPYPERFYPDTADYCSAELIEVAEDEARTGLDQTLPVGGTVSGQLQGVSGTTAVACTGTTSRGAYSFAYTYVAEDGSFTVRGLDSDPSSPEPHRCWVEGETIPDQYLGGGYEDDDAPTYDVTLGANTDLGTFSLLPGISVSGTIYGAGAPVSDGTVYVFATSQVRSVDINSDGSYAAVGLPPGLVYIWAESTGFATTYYPDGDRPDGYLTTSAEGEALTGADLFLPTESVFSVQFSGAGDVSEVSILLYNSTFTVGRGIGASDDGSATIDGLFPGDYTLYVYGSDGGFISDYVRDNAGEPQVFTLGEGSNSFTQSLSLAASISGLVSDEDGNAISGVSLYGYPADGESTRSTSSDIDGAYRFSGLTATNLKLQANYAWYCGNDPGYVTAWWEESYLEEMADYLTVADAEEIEDIDFVMPRDNDHDSMGDTWEAEHGLDTTRDDGAEDFDGDGYTNLEEWWLGSNPADETTLAEGCGCSGGKDSAGLIMLVLAGLWRRRREARPLEPT